MMKKRLILAAVIILGIVTVLVLSREDSGRGISTGIQVYISPTDTVIKVNGGDVKLAGNSRLGLDPGEYTVTGSREDFKEASQKVKVEKGKVTEVVVSLIPANEKGKAVIAKEKERLVREEITYRRSIGISESVAEKTPLTKLLPAITGEFRIDYGTSKTNPDDPTKVAIFITTDNIPQQTLATDWIRSKGYNPDELEIYYRFYEN